MTEFQRIILQAMEAGVSERELADACEVSPASVRRWARGRDRPHRVHQEALIPDIRTLTQSKLGLSS